MPLQVTGAEDESGSRRVTSYAPGSAAGGGAPADRLARWVDAMDVRLTRPLAYLGAQKPMGTPPGAWTTQMLPPAPGTSIGGIMVVAPALRAAASAAWMSGTST